MATIDLGEWKNRLSDYAMRMARLGENRPSFLEAEEIVEDTQPYRGAMSALDYDEIAELVESFYRSFDSYRRPRRGGFRRRSQTARFNRCVKGVKQAIVPRPKSSKESAAIAICTKSVLQTRGRTLKKYRKGRLLTQKLLR